MTRPQGTRARRRGADRGFTLIELMIIVALIGILAAMSIGFSSGFRRRSDLNTAAREIYNGLNTARAEALRKSVTTCMQFKPERFYVFVDLNANWNYDGEFLFYTYPPSPKIWPPGMTVTVSANIVTNNGQDLFVFDSEGFLIDIMGQPIAGSIVINDAQLGETRTIDVTIAGALRIQ